MIGLICWLPTPLAAQISFQWETRRQDTLYQTVEDCLGLLFQVWGRTVDWDTTAYVLRSSSQRVAANSVHDTVTTVARHCGQKFSIDSIVASASTDPALPLNALSLFVKAKRDADAIALVERWTAQLPEAEDSLRNFIRSKAVQLFMNDKPTRFAAIRRLTDAMNFTTFWAQQINSYGEMMMRAMALRDTAEFDRAVAWLLAVNQRANDSLKQLPDWNPPKGSWGPGVYIFKAITWTQRAKVLDKLRHSTESYLEFLNVLRNEAGYKDPQREEVLAKPIVADYWFPAKPVVGRPTRGKVAVVMPLLNHECNPCWYRENIWGRIAKRFPEVELTLLARTYGTYNRYVGALSAEEEAQLLDSIHRQVYGFPGAVAVQETQWWRFEEPYDRRVVEERGPNEDQYPLFALMSPPRIIDRYGRFIPYTSLSLDDDESLMLLFEALINQPVP